MESATTTTRREKKSAHRRRNTKEKQPHICLEKTVGGHVASRSCLKRSSSLFSLFVFVGCAQRASLVYPPPPSS